MRQLNLILLLLLFPAIANAAAPTRGYNYVAHTTIDPAQNNSNENALYSYLQAGVDTYAAGSIDNSDISGIAAISYSKLNLIGSVTNNDISASAGIVASKLDLTSPGAIGSIAPNTGAFTTLVGTSVTGTTLFTTSNVGIGTSTAIGGRLMVQGGNVGIGTVNANEKLIVSGKVYSTSGGFQFPDNTIQTSAVQDKIAAYNTTAPLTKFIEVGGSFNDLGIAFRTGKFSRTGTVNVGFTAKALNGAATGTAYIRKNGVQSGTTRNLTSSYQDFTEDLSVSAGDYFELFVATCNNNCNSSALWVSAGNPSDSSVTSADGNTAYSPIWSSGNGVPTNITCQTGDLYSRLDGSTSTTLYVCTASNTWTAK